MFKTKKYIKDLETQIESLQKYIEGYKKREIKYQNDIYENNKKILSLAIDKKKYEAMKKYYKMDEEPSIEVQAKVLADIRLHDMEYKQLLEQMERCYKALELTRISTFHPYFTLP